MADEEILGSAELILTSNVDGLMPELPKKTRQTSY